jgi:hypothetical protein
MFKIYLKCNNYNRAFSDWLPLSYVYEEGGKIFTFLKLQSPGLHFWRFLKQIRKRIGSKLTVFYKNVIISQNFTWKCQNLNLNFTWFLPEFHSWGLFTPPPPLRYVPGCILCKSSTLLIYDKVSELCVWFAEYNSSCKQVACESSVQL